MSDYFIRGVKLNKLRTLCSKLPVMYIWCRILEQRTRFISTLHFFRLGEQKGAQFVEGPEAMGDGVLRLDAHLRIGKIRTERLKHRIPTSDRNVTKNNSAVNHTI